jgi:hypothetical protein
MRLTTRAAVDKILLAVALIMMFSSHLLFSIMFMEIYAEEDKEKLFRTSIDNYGEANLELFLFFVSFLLIAYLGINYIKKEVTGNRLFERLPSIGREE